MVKKEGKYTANARVDVDYSKGKPKINFSYPGNTGKKDAVKHGARMEIAFLIALILISPAFILYLTYDNKETPTPNFYQNFSTNESHFNQTIIYTGDFNKSFNYSYNYFLGFNLSYDNETHTFEWDEYYGEFREVINKTFWEKYLELFYLFWMYLSIPISIIINKQITKILVKKKWYQKWLPKANADGFLIKRRSKKYKKYLPKDLLENIIVIPKFSNVELDYKTHGDFSKQLQKIKIREYRNQKINIKTKKKSKQKIDKMTWYAVFFFKEKPKDGYMEVIYQ